jgi:uncharacterized protein involved in exopolysaccharide biosynthesis
MWLKKWFFLAGFAFGIVLAVGSIVTEEPRYRATVVTMAATPLGSEPRARGGQLSGLAALAGLSMGNQSVDLQETLAVLRSRSFTEAFVEENNLLPVLFAESWNQTTDAWQAEIEDPPSLDDAVRLIDKNIRFIEVDDISGIIQVHVEWSDRFLAAKWANALVEQLNRMIRERAIEEAKKAERFLYDELAKINNLEVERSIYQLLQTNVQKIMYANVNQEYALKIIDPAVVVDPERKINLSRNAKLVLGVVLGCIMGIIGAVSAELISPSLRRDAGPA